MSDTDDKCKRCKGWGQVSVPSKTPGINKLATCPKCKGTGKK